MNIEITEVKALSRQLMHGRRPLADETLADFIERVIMRLPGKQRVVRFHAEHTVHLNYFEPSYVYSPKVP